MRNVLHILAIATATFFAAGCATPPNQGSATAATATCEVCRYNNDLACVCVKLKDSTPHADYEGQTYYFCSDDCRKAFLNKPKKYLSSSRPAQALH